MNVLITGAAGFLGSHLCDRLLFEGHDVIGMDNFVTGNPQNLAHLSGHNQFSFMCLIPNWMQLCILLPQHLQIQNLHMDMSIYLSKP